MVFLDIKFKKKKTDGEVQHNNTINLIFEKNDDIVCSHIMFKFQKNLFSLWNIIVDWCSVVQLLKIAEQSGRPKCLVWLVVPI